MDELVVLDVVATQPEAEILCALLRSAGIHCTYRVTNRGAGAADGLSVGGPQEVIVRSDEVESAREAMAAFRRANATKGES